MTEAAARYEIGYKIVNPETGDASLFAGYDVDGNETWCDVCTTEWGEDGLCAPETKTFVGFNGSWIRWRQKRDAFAAAVNLIQ